MLNKIFRTAHIERQALLNINEWFNEGERFVCSFRLGKSELILSNLGIYCVLFKQGTGKKANVFFYPKHLLQSVRLKDMGIFKPQVLLSLNVLGYTKQVEDHTEATPIQIKLLAVDKSKVLGLMPLLKEWTLRH